MNKITETSFENFLGIDTLEAESTGEKTVGTFIGKRNETQVDYAYAASEYSGLVKIFDKVSLCPDDTLVDIGCGLGRVIFYCNQRFMCNVTGVEYDKEIFDKLLENADYYHVRFKNQENKFKLLNMRAEDYIIKKSDNFFYMFNPFSKDILDKVLNKIAESLNDNPRKVTIILYYCTYEMMEAMRGTPFKLKDIIKLGSYREDPDEKVYVYESV